MEILIRVCVEYYWMAKKKLSLSVIFLLILEVFFLLSGSNRTIFSQVGEYEVLGSPFFDQAYQNYLRKIDEYNTSHEEYLLKRSQFLSFKTLKSRQDAQDATAKMLRLRDEVVVSYIRVLEARLKDTGGVTKERIDDLVLRLEEEKSWFSSHQESISSDKQLDELVVKSKEAEARFKKATSLFYEVSSTISEGIIFYYSKRTENIFNTVKNKLDEIRTEIREEYSFSSDKFKKLDSWMLESQDRLTKSKDRQAKAQDLISKLSKAEDILSQYNFILSTLEESRSFLLDSNAFLKEVIREIKIAE